MRIVECRDIEPIRGLLESWLTLCKRTDYEMDCSVERVAEELEMWLMSMVGTLLVAYDGVEPVGFMAVFECKSPVGRDNIALEKYWFCRPNTTMAGPALYRAAMEWARKQDCTHMVMSASMLASDMHDKVSRYCEAVGMRLFETSYIVKV